MERAYNLFLISFWVLHFIAWLGLSASFIGPGGTTVDLTDAGAFALLVMAVLSVPLLFLRFTVRNRHKNNTSAQKSPADTLSNLMSLLVLYGSAAAIFTLGCLVPTAVWPPLFTGRFYLMIGFLFFVILWFVTFIFYFVNILIFDSKSRICGIGILTLSMAAALCANQFINIYTVPDNSWMF
jgi:hypothetical protein